MILVDSSVWIDYFNGKDSLHTKLLDELIGHERILMGDLIFIEVLQGFHNQKDYDLTHDLLSRFPHVELIGKGIAYQSIENFRFLRKKGITIRKTIDVIIGSYCIYHQIPLLHADKDFDPMVEYLNLKVL